MVLVEYSEKTGTILGLLKVTEDDGSVREIYLPKPIIDLIKIEIQNGAMNMRTLLDRTINISKEL